MKVTPLNIPALIKMHGLKLDKRLGQNFLIDEQILRKIIYTAQLSGTEDVLEIGAGVGNLTRYLAASAGKVVAVEIDQRLLPILRQVVEPFSNVSIIHGDILKLDPSSLFPFQTESTGYLVVANIPYYITSAVIRHLLTTSYRPRSLFLTVQREVAERICAQPGALSLLGLSVQVYGQPTIVFHISAGAFYPPPKIDSSLVQVQIYPKPRIPEAQLNSFFKLIKAGFSQKRKKIRNALIAGLHWPAERVENLLAQAAVNPSGRAETLSLEEWAVLTSHFSIFDLA
jgi:16S rRNA (adenine1518-N6/adenine1519-N6)-dimethyltransferase